MHDPLLYREIKDVPISKIQECVSKATRIPLDTMLMKIRKREIVNARQISMSLSKRFTIYSLAVIGAEHGGKDHATVLHACKTVENLLDTKDMTVTRQYKDALECIRNWNNLRTDVAKKPTLSQLRRKRTILLLELNEVYHNIAKLEKMVTDHNMVKIWIKNRVPLEIREFRCKFYKKIKT